MAFYIEHYLETTATLVAVIVFIALLASSIYHKQEIELFDISLRSVAAAGIPVSLALLYCVYEPSLLPKLGAIQLYIAITGLVVLVISLVGVGVIKGLG